MAQNPMQVKVRNARLIGLLIGLLIGAVVCVFLFMQLNKIKKERDAEKAAYTNAYILSKSVKSGTEITSADLITISLPRSAVPSNYISAISDNKVAKIDLESGTIITEAMITPADEITTADTRLQEYTMIVLPTYLEIDDYIDIRLALPNGQDLIVLPKKRVYDIDADTIWLKMNEDETIALNSAIIESYVIKGSKLYAAPYVEPGSQTASTATYVPTREVVDLINKNSNISQETKTKLASAYNQSASIRSSDLAAILAAYSQSSQSNIEAGVTQDKETMKEARTKYFNTLNSVE